MKKNRKSRCFATIIYAESAPKDFKEKIRKMKIPAYLICHDKDLNENGDLKKEHYHLILLFSGVRTEESVKKILNDAGLNSVGLQVCYSKQGSLEYLIHMNDEGKHRYNMDDVEAFNTIPYHEALKRIDVTSFKYDTLADIVDLVEEKNFFSFSILVRYCKEHEPRFFNALAESNASHFMVQYLNARSYEKKIESDS